MNFKIIGLHSYIYLTMTIYTHQIVIVDRSDLLHKDDTNEKIYGEKISKNKKSDAIKCVSPDLKM